jgi:hypothetical protein
MLWSAENLQVFESDLAVATARGFLGLENGSQPIASSRSMHPASKAGDGRRAPTCSQGALIR